MVLKSTNSSVFSVWISKVWPQTISKLTSNFYMTCHLQLDSTPAVPHVMFMYYFVFLFYKNSVNLFIEKFWFLQKPSLTIQEHNNLFLLWTTPLMPHLMLEHRYSEDLSLNLIFVCDFFFFTRQQGPLRKSTLQYSQLCNEQCPENICQRQKKLF